MTLLNPRSHRQKPQHYSTLSKENVHNDESLFNKNIFGVRFTLKKCEFSLEKSFLGFLTHHCRQPIKTEFGMIVTDICRGVNGGREVHFYSMIFTTPSKEV